MAQVGESIDMEITEEFEPKFVLAAISEITFESGIDVWWFDAQGGDLQMPAAGKPHWSRSGYKYPSVHVREGGKGEVKTLKIKVSWVQWGCEGSAKLEGTSPDVKISGDFNISGNVGEAEVKCEFTKRPSVVMNYGQGLPMDWQVTVAGETQPVTGGTPLTLYFVDAKPRLIGWDGENKSFNWQIVDWGTSWAQGKAGEADVFAALWDKFSDGKAARIPHITGYEYWKTGRPVQNLHDLTRPGTTAAKDGWSCRAIAHTFMECLALHGIKCQEVIPNTAGGTHMFLVQNWRREPAPRNWPKSNPIGYYGGSWISIRQPPLARYVGVTVGDDNRNLAVVDIEKRYGVPAQGQAFAPLGFSNHWVVLTRGKLHDTSYGAAHSNSPATYAAGALAGWVVRYYPGTVPGSNPPQGCSAYICHSLDKHVLIAAYERTN